MTTIDQLHPATRHAPGPWVYTLDAKGICGIHQANNASGVPARIGEVVSNSQKRAEANARLIAAAPAQAVLLDMLRHGVLTLTDGDAEFEGVMYAFDSNSPDWNALLQAIGWDTIRAAIAKATLEGRTA